MASKRRYQKRVEGGRAKHAPYLLPDVARMADQEAMRYNVSRSFVEAVRLARSYGVPVSGYEAVPRPKRKGRR